MPSQLCVKIIDEKKTYPHHTKINSCQNSWECLLEVSVVLKKMNEFSSSLKHLKILKEVSKILQ